MEHCTREKNECPYLPISPKMNLKNNVKLKNKTKTSYREHIQSLPCTNRPNLSSLLSGQGCSESGPCTSNTSVTRELRNVELWPHCRLTESEALGESGIYESLRNKFKETYVNYKEKSE